MCLYHPGLGQSQKTHPHPSPWGRDTNRFLLGEKETRGLLWLRKGARQLLGGGEHRETWLPVHTLPSSSSSAQPGPRQDVPLDSHGRSPQRRSAAAATPTHQRRHLHEPEQQRGLLLLQGKHLTFLWEFYGFLTKGTQELNGLTSSPRVCMPITNRKVLHRHGTTRQHMKRCSF